MVYKLTVEGYGVYALLASLAGFYSLIDLGIGQGVTKFVAEYNARDDYYAANQAINSALWVQVIAGTVVSAGLIIFAKPIVEFLHVPPDLRSDSLVGLYVSAAGFFFMTIAGTLSAVLMGLQRYDYQCRWSRR